MYRSRAHVGGSKLKRHKSVVHRILHTLSPCLWVEVLGYPELKRHKVVVHKICHTLSLSWRDIKLWSIYYLLVGCSKFWGYPKLKRHKSVVLRVWHTLSPWWRVSVLCFLGHETLTVFSCASWMCGVSNCLGRLKLKSHTLSLSWRDIKLWSIYYLLVGCSKFWGYPKLKRHKSVVLRVWHTLSPWWRVSVLCFLGHETLTVFSCASWMCGVSNCLGRLKLKSHKSVVHRTWHTLSTWWRAPRCPPPGFETPTVSPRASCICGFPNYFELPIRIYVWYWPVNWDSFLCCSMFI